MRAIILMICLLFSLSSKTNLFISTALCLIRNKTVQEEALNILNKILNKDYENIFQNLATSYIKVKDVLLSECLNKDDDNHAALRKLDLCDESKFDACLKVCFDEINRLPKEFQNSKDIEKCALACYNSNCV